MPYSEILIKPMREDLTNLGVEETRLPQQVEDAVANTPGALMVIVNSVCGCAAGKARPGIARALQHPVKPARSITVFAGADIDATNVARGYFTGYAPSSPSIGLLKEGKLVWMLQRFEIEGRSADQIADVLKAAFDKHCAPAQAAAAS